MEIHALFVFKDTGESLYSRIFSRKYKNLRVNLISPLLSAFFSFSDKVLSEQPEVLEMGSLKLYFRKREGLFFSLLADASLNRLFLESCMKKILELFFYGMEEKKWQEGTLIEDEKLDSVVDEIIAGGTNLLKKLPFYLEIDQYFKKWIMKNEIVGAALITTTGDIIHNTLPKNVLMSAIKELEIRFTTGISNFPELYYSLENGQKVFSKMMIQEDSEVDFLLVLLFEKSVQLGMAQVRLNKVAEELMSF